MKKRNKFIFIGISIILLVIIDQIIKSLVYNIDFGFLNYVENFGTAFGIFSNSILIQVISIIMIICLIIIILKTKDKKIEISGIFIISGSIGNLIDRILKGYVVDYIDIKLFDFPVFNLADIFVCMGVIFLAVCIINKILKMK